MWGPTSGLPSSPPLPALAITGHNKKLSNELDAEILCSDSDMGSLELPDSAFMTSMIARIPVGFQWRAIPSVGNISGLYTVAHLVLDCKAAEDPGMSVCPVEYLSDVASMVEDVIQGVYLTPDSFGRRLDTGMCVKADLEEQQSFSIGNISAFIALSFADYDIQHGFQLLVYNFDPELRIYTSAFEGPKLGDGKYELFVRNTNSHYEPLMRNLHASDQSKGGQHMEVTGFHYDCDPRFNGGEIRKHKCQRIHPISITAMQSAFEAIPVPSQEMSSMSLVDQRKRKEQATACTPERPKTSCKKLKETVDISSDSPKAQKPRSNVETMQPRGQTGRELARSMHASSKQTTGKQSSKAIPDSKPKARRRPRKPKQVSPPPAAPAVISEATIARSFNMFCVPEQDAMRCNATWLSYGRAAQDRLIVASLMQGAVGLPLETMPAVCRLESSVDRTGAAEFRQRSCKKFFVKTFITVGEEPVAALYRLVAQYEREFGEETAWMDEIRSVEVHSPIVEIQPVKFYEDLIASVKAWLGLLARVLVWIPVGETTVGQGGMLLQAKGSVLKLTGDPRSTFDEFGMPYSG